MRMFTKKKPVSLAEKINSLVTAVPSTFESDDEVEETKAKVVEYTDESEENYYFENTYTRSSIRKQNAALLEDIDHRYKGKKVSSKQIFNEDSNFEESLLLLKAPEDEGNLSSDFNDQDQSVNSSVISNGKERKNYGKFNKGIDLLHDTGDVSDANNISSKYSDEDEEEDFDDINNDVDLSNPLRRDRGSERDIKTMTGTNVRGEIEKGNCIREQLKLWENLLEMRIKLQKCLVISNKMPQYDVYKNYASNSELKKIYKSSELKLGSLLSNLLDLQSNLLNKFPETKGILSKGKKRKLNEENGELEKEEEDSMKEEILSECEDEINKNTEGEEEEEEEFEQMNENENKSCPVKKLKLSEFEKMLAKNHRAYKDYRDSVIQKWNDKSRIASGVISKSKNQPVLRQIEFAMGNKEKVIRKSQLKRSEYEVIGKSATLSEGKEDRRVQEYDGEIYDDDDFYHQLLRELIEYKSADMTDPIQLSKQWIKLQSMRSKMKRKIDTRATKGRRIRYNIYQKLVNFMAPINLNDRWTEHAKDELYNSLFGKMKSWKKQENYSKEEADQV